MNIVFALFGACFWLFLWMYLVSYMMHAGIGMTFIHRTRLAVLRWMCVAFLFLFFKYTPWLQDLIRRDWVIFPAIFFFISLPFSWHLLKGYALYPIFLSVCVFLVSGFLDSSMIHWFWSSYHEEIAKWYQSMTLRFPAILWPFVSLWFAFVENFVYFRDDMSWSQLIGRNVFSLPLHIFATLFALWVFLTLKSRTFWIIIWIIGAIMIHALFNWSLTYSYQLVTFILMILWYMFYGWSLENGWWKWEITNTGK